MPPFLDRRRDLAAGRQCSILRRRQRERFLAKIEQTSTGPGVPERPPGPTSALGLALLALRGDLLGIYEAMGGHGDLSYVHFGHHNVYMVKDPECIRDVLVTDNRKFMKGQATQEAKRLLGEGLLTSDGDLHRRQRRLVQPVFHPDRQPEQAALTVEHAQRVADSWGHREIIDIGETMMALTLTVLGKAVIGVELEPHIHTFAEALDAAVDMVELVLKPWGRYMERLPVPLVRRFRATRDRLFAFVDQIIEDRRANLNGQNDLVAILLGHQAELGEDVLTHTQIRDELVTILLTGHETLTQLMTWTFYLLAGHPDVMADLHAELDSVIGNDRPGLSHLPELTRAEAILLESMRVYPPVYALQRNALVDYELQGYRVPKGSLLVMSQYLLHHSERWFEDPERFDPSRWTPELRRSLPDMAYFPFGHGPRACIGKAFAMMQAQLLLATLLRDWGLRRANDQPVSTVSSISLRPSAPVRVVLEKREGAR
jgi:cytochrome P450